MDEYLRRLRELYGPALAQILGRGAAPPAAAAPPPPSPGSGSGMPGNPDAEMLPTELFPEEADVATGTRVPGAGGSPTQRPEPVAGVDTPPHASPTTELQRQENARWQAARLFQDAIDALAKLPADASAAAQKAAQDLVTTRQVAFQSAQNAAAAEANRVRDDERAAQTRADAQKEKEKAEAEKANSTPKNGDTRTSRVTHNGVTATITEKYQNGSWSYVPNSATPETGLLGTAEQKPGTVLTDGQGAYWMVDTTTGTAKALNGPAAAVKTVNDPDGSVWLQNPDGSKKTKLFDSAPGTYTTSDGRLIGYDKRSGQQIFALDTQTPEGRALAERLQKATVEAAELANQPKFGTATAQYQAEASRRQDLARKELARLTDLQKSGQISPDQAEAQFDRWMQLNVEGPLAGYKAAAEEERRKLEQENLTRTTAEQGRVDTLNRQREQLAHAAGEAGRQEAITLGQGTRATEYISDLGGLANRMAAGPMGGPNAAPGFQFSAGAFDPANFRKVVPNVNELADAAVNRLLSRVSPATARDVNVPLPALPTGPDLTGIMNQVKYQGPLSAMPQAEAALPGQEAVDLGTGRARTVFGNGRYYDWDIPPA